MFLRFLAEKLQIDISQHSDGVRSSSLDMLQILDEILFHGKSLFFSVFSRLEGHDGSFRY